MTPVFRAWRIGRVLLRYRLDDLLDDTPAERWLKLARPFVPRASAEVAAQSRGARLRLALQELGPIFVKFGQILSTRRDLVPPDVAEELALLQDRVAPFDGETARAIVERRWACRSARRSPQFDTTPLASASIAQVHAATLPAEGDGAARSRGQGAAPEHREADRRRHRPAQGRGRAWSTARIRPPTRSARARSWRRSRTRSPPSSTCSAKAAMPACCAATGWTRDDLYVPEVIWSHTAERALTMERVRGIPSDDIAALDAAGIDRKALAAKGVRVFYTQVFRDNFFHADAHAGNIWVDADRRKANPRFIALDFGIMGQLSGEDQYYLAENFMAIFNRDYRRIAELHVQAGWMPSHIRIDELEAAARSVCEPYFTRPLSEISLAEVLVKLFRTAQRYELTLAAAVDPAAEDAAEHRGRRPPARPQARHLGGRAAGAGEDPASSATARSALANEFRKRLPELVTHAPEMPRLLHAWLTQQVEGKHALHMRFAATCANWRATLRACQRRTIAAILGTGLLIVAAVLYALEAGGPRLLGVRRRSGSPRLWRDCGRCVAGVAAPRK